jgi:O-antigen/teichoic acid export membrane protein
MVLENSLKQQTLKGIIWSFTEKFGSLFLQFISNVVLARLLMPSDFGIIGLLMIFIAICNTIVEGGFGSALIQKQTSTESDFSTIFILNIVFSITLFILLFFTAPLISIYFREGILKIVLRVLGLVLVFNALSIVQNSQVIRNLNFKLIARINLLSSAIASTISILSALLGLGVWSLVTQLLALSFFRTLFLWIWNSWRPQFLFDITSAKELIGFGSKILISSLLDTIICEYLYCNYWKEIFK